VSNRIWLATRKGLFSIERHHARWSVGRTAFLGDNLTMVLPDRRDGSVHAAFHHGHFGVKMQRSRDGGATWEELPAPAYPKQPEGHEERDPWGKVIPWKVDRVWALAPGGPEEPGVLWCGTIPGALFRSEDGGASWNFVRTLWDHPKRKEWFGGGADLPGIHSICVDPRNSKHVSLGVSCGGVWHTWDGGETWESRAQGMWAAYMPAERKYDPNIQDPHCVVRCPSAPDHLWAQHHNGVFRTTDNGAHWEDVSGLQPSSFGFAVAVHPHDPETAWFVPAVKDECRIPVDGRVVVTRTRDGGKSCSVLREGLPQEHAYDITFRHALDVDETGQRLAFGTTTGSVWVSENGGDSWVCAGDHLPPIYCVRFEK
jgi:photosystem II stability/assembly factor-like uncharacterized protein